MPQIGQGRRYGQKSRRTQASKHWVAVCADINTHGGDLAEAWLPFGGKVCLEIAKDRLARLFILLGHALQRDNQD
ncbi:hypothetical protein, partial [Sinorhizobium fredii]|uniref:hypothetical protein n=1 Tax=Rhizobium fredii TaxID=380 RepID=UPI0012FD0F60